MAEVDSRTQEDEPLANAKLVDPDEPLVPATNWVMATIRYKMGHFAE
jgi:hypothetical protein